MWQWELKMGKHFRQKKRKGKKKRRVPRTKLCLNARRRAIVRRRGLHEA